MEQLSEAWFEARKGKITGSKVSTVIGMNPYQKPKELIRTMVREYHGAEPEFTGNVATEWGNAHEAQAREMYQFMLEADVKEAGFIVHPEYDWLGASPDGLIGDEGVLEIKCPYSQKIPDEPDKHYVAQCQFIMWVTGRKYCDLFYWTPEEHVIFPIQYDPEYFSVDMLRAFYDWYLSELDNPEHLQPLIQVRTDDDYLTAAKVYREAKNALQVAQEAEKAAKQALIELSGGISCEGDGVYVSSYVRQGNVQYKNIPQLSEVNLDDYRGKSTTVYRVDVK